MVPKNTKILHLTVVLLIFACCKHEKSDLQRQIDPGGNWYLFSDAFTDSIPASVPGNVYLDMQRAGIISRPYLSDNAKNLRKYSAYTYRYSLRFEKPEASLPQLGLLFEGIDTRADVLLNGDTLGKTNNMFRSWRFSVDNKLIDGKNHLEVIIHSPDSVAAKHAAADSLLLPQQRAYLRKAPFQSGWDWAPALPGAGIWKPVHLETYADARIEHAAVHTLKCDSTKADMLLRVRMLVETPGKYQVRLSGEGISLEKNQDLEKGSNTVMLPFQIDNPNLWFPNGMGKPVLYNASLKISNSAYSYHDSLRFGVRSIELRRKKDSIGESFGFYVNNRPVFARGANYVPQDVFLQRSNHQALLSDAVHAGFNLLRVWGGGIYESDRFYAICDSLGIMVWQDFMFACTLYPGDDNFFANVKAEVTEQTVRLSGHPCLALWCGNNEVKNAWFDWGWQDVYGWNKKDSAAIWDANRRLFEDSIPKWLHKSGAQEDYLSSSPVWGWGHPESLTEGDNHYWGVWWGDELFSSYYEHTGRFMSEFGFQAYPNISSIEKFTAPEDRRTESKIMQAHQKHPFGEERIREFADIYTGAGDSFEDYAMRTQMLQARGISDAIRWFRISPRCAGSLYWQFNDAWPAISWSSRDYYGGLKALHYTAKRAHQENMLFAREFRDTLIWYAISDKDKKNLSLDVCWIDFNGDVLYNKTFDINLKAGKRFMVEDTFAAVATESCIAHAVLSQGGEPLAYYTYWPEKAVTMDLPEANVQIREVERNAGTRLEITTDVFIPMLILESRLRLSDNAFSLLPGETHYIYAEGNNSLTKDDVRVWWYEQ
ncbi:MAG: beta-mannosidase [Bacteroidota bacterium]